MQPCPVVCWNLRSDSNFQSSAGQFGSCACQAFLSILFVWFMCDFLHHLPPLLDEGMFAAEAIFTRPSSVYADLLAVVG